jgi:hypothetical protein
MPEGLGTNYEIRRYKELVSRSKYLCGLLKETVKCSSYTASVMTMNKYEKLVEWYWKGKTVVLREKPAPISRCSPQIPHGLVWDSTWDSRVRGRRLTA